jgi:hypothetical protein
MKKLITLGAMLAVFTMLLGAPLALAQDETDALIAPSPETTSTQAGLLIPRLSMKLILIQVQHILVLSSDQYI